jgi:CTP:molybdopterin cytidylyltransferase MocA
MLIAIILAAGRSSRMGRPKALLPHADGVTTFVAYAIRTARAAGVSTIVVVGRPGDDSLRVEAMREAALFVVNPDPDRGPLSSLVSGLDDAEDHDATAIMVMPVDVPAVSAEALKRLIDAAAASPLPIARASTNGAHGHPVIFKRAVFNELRAADQSLGAREVVRRDPSRVLDVEVGDTGVTLDVNTPEDYRRAFGRYCK